MSDTERIEHLETIVRALHQQVETLRTELDVLRAALPGAAAPPVAPVADVEAALAHAPAAPATPGRIVPPPSAPPPRPLHPPPPAPPAPAPRHPHAVHDIEAMVGRYGTIALATVALLSGVGAFLTWAVAHGLLGPAARVILGAIGAAAVAAVGAWLRARGTVRFGNTLLAIALALAHVDAWGAGPKLHLIPSSAALAIAAGASVAIALLAHRAREELLFAVGLGGALLAPFVAGGGEGSAPVLAAYGWIVLAAGTLALRDLARRVPALVLWAGCALYAAALLDLATRRAAWWEHHLAVLFVLACACTAIALAPRAIAAPLALALLVIALSPLFVLATGSDAPLRAAMLPLACTLAAYAAERLGERTFGVAFGAAVVLPLGTLAAAVAAVAPPTDRRGAAFAALWTALAAASAWRGAVDRRLHLATAATASAAAIVLALHAHPEWCIVLLSADAVAAVLVARRARALAVLVPASLVLAVAATWAWVRLDARPAYAYLPFAGRASAAALAVAVAWALAAREVSAMGAEMPGDEASSAARLLVAGAVIVPFLWVREELARAFGADIATFLLIVYYAVVGVAAIFHGRRHARPLARAAGLALAFYAGIKALVQAWDISAIGLRVASCILVGLFIALVSYWYRAPDVPRAQPASGD